MLLQARLLFTLQLRLRSQRGKLGDFYAWNACLSHILALAQVRSSIASVCSGQDGCSFFNRVSKLGDFYAWNACLSHILCWRRCAVWFSVQLPKTCSLVTGVS